MSLQEMGIRARHAARKLARAGTDQKNSALRTLADALVQEAAAVLAANVLDVADAEAQGLSEAMIDRLTLNTDRMQAMAADLRKLAEMADPIGETYDRAELSNGMQLYKQRVPLGVLAVIYESRPNVTIDVAGLAIKTGNAAILRGGSETLRSNRALVGIVQRALEVCGLPAEVVQFIDSSDRALVMELLGLHEYVDMLIPRGGESLHRFCRENSRIPVITGGIGICHLFVDESADLDASVKVIYNAKTQRPTVCNALDTVLVHRTVAEEILPRIVAGLSPAGVSFRAHESAYPFLATDEGGGLPLSVCMAGSGDFDIEWLSLVLGLKVVESLDEAIEHIEQHSTRHSDGILTGTEEHARRFLAEVDSAAVYVNASTRFTDGGQFGLGAEVAVSTQRLHARGPMGLRELTTYKWVGIGKYDVRP